MHLSIICFCPAAGFLPFVELPPFFFCCLLFFFEPPPPYPLPCFCGCVSQWSFVLWLFLPHFAQCFLYFFVVENLFIVDDDLEALAFQAFLLVSSWITWSMISCNLYFVIVKSELRYPIIQAIRSQWESQDLPTSGNQYHVMDVTASQEQGYNTCVPNQGYKGTGFDHKGHCLMTADG